MSSNNPLVFNLVDPPYMSKVWAHSMQSWPHHYIKCPSKEKKKAILIVHVEDVILTCDFDELTRLKDYWQIFNANDFENHTFFTLKRHNQTNILFSREQSTSRGNNEWMQSCSILMDQAKKSKITINNASIHRCEYQCLIQKLNYLPIILILGFRLVLWSLNTRWKL